MLNLLDRDSIICYLSRGLKEKLLKESRRGYWSNIAKKIITSSKEDIDCSYSIFRYFQDVFAELNYVENIEQILNGEKNIKINITIKEKKENKEVIRKIPLEDYLKEKNIIIKNYM